MRDRRRLSARMAALQRAEPGSVSGTPVSLGRSLDPSGPLPSYLPNGYMKQHNGLLGEFVQIRSLLLESTVKCFTKASYYGDDLLYG